MLALAISEAEKLLEEHQQNNDGWEFIVPKPEPPTKGLKGPSNNDKGICNGSCCCKFFMFL
jgi:hypothetical protein